MYSWSLANEPNNYSFSPIIASDRSEAIMFLRLGGPYKKILDTVFGNAIMTEIIMSQLTSNFIAFWYLMAREGQSALRR